MFSILGQILLGWLFADLLSGLFHWWEDRVANLDMPIIGKTVILANREHHDKPLDFTNATFFKRNGIVWLIAGIITVIWLLLWGPSVFLFATLVGALLANEVHYLSHLPKKANNFIKIMQETGIIQTPIQHQKHHKGAHDKYYCTLSNLMNPILEYIHFWDGLEYGLTKIGLEPNKGTK